MAMEACLAASAVATETEAGTVEVCRMPLRCTFRAGSNTTREPSRPRAAIMEISNSKETSDSRMSGTPPMTA